MALSFQIVARAVLLAATLAVPRGLVLALPAVDISMNAAFAAPPYILELLETAAAENESVYFPLLDRIAQGAFAKASTDEELYNTFLDTVKQDGLIASEALSTFKLSLSMRSTAPRIEAQYQYYETTVAPLLLKDQASCKQWAWMDGKQWCDPELKKDNGKVKAFDGKEILPFDRSMGSGPVVVLFADIKCDCWRKHHDVLYAKARKGEITYKVRYRRRKAIDKTPLSVSGYGVELALKRTDYIVIDDRDADEKGANAIKPAADALQVVLGSHEEVADLKPLSSSELTTLGMNAAGFIAKSENPMDMLVTVTQDFPRLSSFLAAHNASDEFVRESTDNPVPGGANVLWINGIQLIERQIEVYTLLDLMRRERKLIDALRSVGFSGTDAVSFLSHDSITARARAEQEAPRFDWRDDIEKGEAIIWLNDILKDERYKDWPEDVSNLLYRMMPGQLPAIRREIFTLIVPIDFASPADVQLVCEPLWPLVERGLPIRFGLVPLERSEMSRAQAKIAYNIHQSYGPEVLYEYLSKVSPAEGGEVSFLTAAEYDELLKDREVLGNAEPVAFGSIAESKKLEGRVKHAKAWMKRLAADSDIPTVFADGLAIPKDGAWLNFVSQVFAYDLQTVQRLIFSDKLQPDLWIPRVFINGAVIRRNIHIVPDGDNPLRVVNVHDIYSKHDGVFSKLPGMKADFRTPREKWAGLTVIADLTSDAGLDLVLHAVRFKLKNDGVRLEIIHNPAQSSAASLINSALKHKEAQLINVKTTDDLRALLEGGEALEAFDLALAKFIDDVDLKPGTQNLMLNGRIIGPIGVEPPFELEDFEMLLDFERNKRILPVYEAMDALEIPVAIPGVLAAAKVSSVAAISAINELPEGIFEQVPPIRSAAFKTWDKKHIFFDVGDEKSASIQFTAVINPASEQAQRWVPILKTFSEMEGVYLRVFLNPSDGLSELPVKRFFRYVLGSAPSFDKNGKVESMHAVFRSLPSEALLNVGMHIPPAWLVAPKESVHDLDNIKLSSLKSDVTAVYELQNILIEGHSRELGGQPPAGAQLVLETNTSTHVADTIIMANLGYFQFKANPGYFHIKLKEGRSADIYSMESLGTDGYTSSDDDHSNAVTLMDFQGTTLFPRLSRKPGMEEEEVLEKPVETDSEESTPTKLVDKGLKFASSLFGSKKAENKTASLATSSEHADINIFSVASGHLYERMLNIMIKSVMKHTKHTVKFWFIEQFLSPSFKDFIPHMAREYGFTYEMVTYKWPHWLRSQKEKQREIWGYKILFLDVLFPLSLDKVIFVDADQIVRTDMMDLVQHDLKGAPYGFTPMCDSRTEMEGFRFWKQGYWKGHLRNKPYHISALYVVDLRRFRAIAAGDRLRQQYQALSGDPNSLSNLDQDLPNNMQYQLPIHSLPQDWLWCETWCDDASLRTARTIDLCNNPLTKEPKLARARRQVPEWTAYDEEIAALAARVRSSASTASSPPSQQEQDDMAAAEKHQAGKSPDKRAEKEQETVAAKEPEVDTAAEASTTAQKNPKSRRMDDEDNRKYDKDEL